MVDAMQKHQAHVAVLGGGLTGLSTAFHLARRSPYVHVTVYEQAPRIGGWVRSERVEVEDDDGNRASLVLESAPRTLRPTAKPVLELIHLLGLQNQVLTTPKSAPAARARFLCLSDTDGLSLLPSSLWTLFTTRLGHLVLRGILTDIFWPANRPADATDESVDSFLTRRFGEKFARVLGSALVHGVYAADARVLSVRAAFPSLWDLETRGGGSVIGGAIGPRAWWAAWRGQRASMQAEEAEAWELGAGKDVAFDTRLRGAALLSFADGMETLVSALERALVGLPNVTLRLSTSVTALSHDGPTLTLRSGEDVVEHPTHVVSALPLPRLHTLLPQTQAPPHLLANASQTVAVLNVVFPASRLHRPIHQPGFGYLLPRPASGYPNPGATNGGDDGSSSGIGMLGVVFDTSSLSAQDRALLPHPPEATSSSSPLAPAPVPFVKMTAMLGGPYGVPYSLVADKPALIARVLDRMRTQLGLRTGGNDKFPAPTLTRLHVHTDAIPTPGVGHVERMREMREACVREWGGRLVVVGAGVGGPSVGDCIKAGRDAARELVAAVGA